PTMLNASKLKGVLPAIPTPVQRDGSIDPGATRSLVQFLLREGIDAIVPLGGTGEYGAMARDERRRFAATVVEAIGGKVPVVAGILDPGYHDALDAARGFAD